MKTKSIAFTAAIAFFPIAGFAQTPPAPPGPPVPSAPPGTPDRNEKMPKVPVTFLGVETSEVPSVVSEQLGFAKGFGLVVDYVVPDGPAAAAGVQRNDIIKMLNDQILIDPNQLSKLVRSFSEGTTVTLTVLRKGQEQKITVKLTKKEVSQRDAWFPENRHGWKGNFNDLGDLGDMKLETVDGKKLLTAKDPQVKLLFSGPVETKEDLNKLPPEVRQRYENLQEHDLPAVAPRVDVDEDEDSADANDNEEEIPQPSVEQVSASLFPRTMSIFGR